MPELTYEYWMNVTRFAESNAILAVQGGEDLLVRDVILKDSAKLELISLQKAADRLSEIIEEMLDEMEPKS